MASWLSYALLICSAGSLEADGVVPPKLCRLFEDVYRGSVEMPADTYVAIRVEGLAYVPGIGPNFDRPSVNIFDFQDATPLFACGSRYQMAVQFIERHNKSLRERLLSHSSEN